MSDVLPDSMPHCLSRESWDGQGPAVEGFGDASYSVITEKHSLVQSISPVNEKEPSLSTEASISSSASSQELSTQETVNTSTAVPQPQDAPADAMTSIMDLPLTQEATFPTEQFSSMTPNVSSIHSTPMYQDRERVSVRLVASQTRGANSDCSANMINGQLKLHKKRSSEDDDYTKQDTSKKRKKHTQITNDVPIHLTSNGGIPVDPNFLTSSLSHIPYCAPNGASHNLQIPIDPTHAATSYPPPPPPYNYHALSSNMIPRSQLVADIQTARCMSSKYKQDPFPRCVSCTRRWAGDTCRFQGIRFFLRDGNRHIGGISFVDTQVEEIPKMDFPDKWNAPLDSEKIRLLKMTVARAILPILKAEQEHLKFPELIRRPRETDVRATCDTCMTSIFSCAWMCRICGREACRDCAEKLRELTYPTRAMTPSGGKKMHPNPTFLSCTRKQEHALRDFSPVSRFCQKELDNAVLEMERLLAEDPNSSSPSREPNVFETTEENPTPSDPIMTTAETSSVRSAPGIGSSEDSPSKLFPENPSIPDRINDTVDLPIPVTSRPGDPIDPNGLASHPYHIFDKNITDLQFSELWKDGQTLIVTGLLDNFLIKWMPEYFIESFEQNQCLILECNTNENKSVTVGQFFRDFGRFEGRSKIWKLKDWPPSADFETAFPALYEDFLRAVPVPNYTRRDGCLNIASHFPRNTLSPDLGPKMYNAFASSDLPGSKGTTRLHLDMADAVNIMLYSTKRPDGGEGMAVWDIFRAEDADKIRQFLSRHFKDQFANDPIHAQVFYLDVELRKRLHAETGVYSWRIYQRPGDAVFIPAGCAHQVVNYSDCIKVACDFVSPQNVDRCFMLTRQFREQNRTLKWKEDVLQVSAMLWFSWLNLTKVERSHQTEQSNEETSS